MVYPFRVVGSVSPPLSGLEDVSICGATRINICLRGVISNDPAHFIFPCAKEIAIFIQRGMLTCWVYGVPGQVASRKAWHSAMTIFGSNNQTSLGRNLDTSSRVTSILELLDTGWHKSQPC
jgi:hypothetical protein